MCAVELHHAALTGRVKQLNADVKELQRLLDGRTAKEVDRDGPTAT